MLAKSTEKCQIEYKSFQVWYEKVQRSVRYQEKGGGKSKLNISILPFGNLVCLFMCLSVSRVGPNKERRTNAKKKVPI